MSAVELGTRLVAEIHEQRLDELLTSLRILHDPSSWSHLGIRPLDRLISLFANVDFPSTIDPPLNPKPPAFVEISSPGPGQGKTQLLYYIAAINVLPRFISDSSLGGQEGSIVVLDTESRFSVPRLTLVLRHLILHSFPDISNTDVTTTVKEALAHVHIFQPQSMASLIATTANLQTYLFTNKHHSSNRSLRAILVDSTTSFFWSDRASSEAQGTPSSYPALASTLRKTSIALRAPVLYTTWYLGASAQPFTLRPQLPYPWPTLPVLRLVVSRKEVRKFGLGVGAEEAQRDRDARSKAVEEAGFEIRVNGFGSDEWEGRIREGLRTGDGFVMRVSEGGVEIEEGV